MEICMPLHTQGALPAPAQTLIRKRSAIMVRRLQRHARNLAEYEYNARKGPVVCASDIQKIKRNRSAFISRQSQRHYEKLLEGHVQNSEKECEKVLRSCMSFTSEVQSLRMRLASLAENLASISPPKSISELSTLSKYASSESTIDEEIERMVSDAQIEAKATKLSHAIELTEFDSPPMEPLKSVQEPDAAWGLLDDVIGVENWRTTSPFSPCPF